jgi:hypothetical protein
MRPLFLISLFFISACALSTKHRGFVFPHDLDEQVALVKTSKDLEERFGSPQARTMFGDKVWIYYGADETYRGPMPQTYGDKTALLAWLDQSGRVTKTRILREDDFPGAWLDSDETPIPAAIELNAIEELVNNVGRFTPAGLGQ